MRAVYIALLAAPLLAQDPARDFSGEWRLNRARSDIRALPEPPAESLRIEQRGATVRIAGGTAVRTISIGAKEGATLAKWEGAALLFNTLGPNYTLMERWKLSADQARLTIALEYLRGTNEADSTLVYERPMAQAAAPATSFTVPRGTPVPLKLLNSVSTKQSRAGDRIYLTTMMPLVTGGRIVIPAGSYVAGTITTASPPGRVKGRGELYLRFDSLTLPNGTTRDLRSRPGGGDMPGELDRQEGKIKGEGSKGVDARHVGEATAAGASVGAIAGSAAAHAGMGLGVGAAAGAAAGLAGVLLTRGPGIVLPQGTTIEMLLDRDLQFDERELR